MILLSVCMDQWSSNIFLLVHTLTTGTLFKNPPEKKKTFFACAHPSLQIVQSKPTTELFRRFLKIVNEVSPI